MTWDLSIYKVSYSCFVSVAASPRLPVAVHAGLFSVVTYYFRSAARCKEAG